MSTGFDVAIVGGGVIGCAAARKLAPDHDVIVLERGQLAAEATALAAGEITMTPSYTDYPAIGDHATEFFREYDGTGDFELTEIDSFELVLPESSDAARRRVERQSADGIDVEFLETEALEARIPRFDLDMFDGVITYPDTGFVDPYTYAMTLKDDAEQRGAEFRTNVEVTEVLVDDDGVVSGVRTEDGNIEAESVIAAAGWRTREFLLDLVEIPIRPYRTQCVVLEPDEELPEEFPMGWVPGEHVYFRPELNGDLLIGGWSFEEDDPLGASSQADEEFVDHVAELLPQFLPDFARSRFVNGWAGIDGASPDTRPIVDAPDDAPDGLIVATGFNGRGIMTSPVAATTIKELLTGEKAPFPIEAFSIDRFDSRSDDFEFHSISA